MDLYGYIADNNPYMAKSICHKYGYKISGVNTKSDLGVCLRQLVAKEGEPALKDIVDNHPDKQLILELETADGNYKNACGGHHGCNCGCGGGSKTKELTYSDFMNFIGEEKNQRKSYESQGNTFLLASAFLLGVAIISTNLKK